MSRIVLLDSGPLGMFANPSATPKNEECRRRVNQLLVDGVQVKAPGIAVYETRRELVRLQLQQPAARRLTRFDAAVATLGIVPVDEATMHRATIIWGEARHKEHVTAPPEALDGDVILAAQAILETEGGDQVEIATSNSGDLQELFGHILNWDDLKH